MPVFIGSPSLSRHFKKQPFLQGVCGWSELCGKLGFGVLKSVAFSRSIVLPIACFVGFHLQVEQRHAPSEASQARDVCIVLALISAFVQGTAAIASARQGLPG